MDPIQVLKVIIKKGLNPDAQAVNPDVPVFKEDNRIKVIRVSLQCNLHVFRQVKIFPEIFQNRFNFRNL